MPKHEHDHRDWAFNYIRSEIDNEISSALAVMAKFEAEGLPGAARAYENIADGLRLARAIVNGVSRPFEKRGADATR